MRPYIAPIGYAGVPAHQPTILKGDAPRFRPNSDTGNLAPAMLSFRLMAQHSTSQAGFSHGQRLSFVAIAILGATGVALQFIQTEDPRFPLWYFTVDSAIASSVLALVQSIRGRATAGAVTTSFFSASLVSGVVFWAAIFPVNRLGEEPAVIAANLFLHVALPVALLAAQRGTRLFPPHGSVLICLIWPALYFVITWVTAFRGVGQIPYAFMDYNEVGLPLPLLAVAVVGALLTGTTATLRWLQRI